jgi:endonuclease/exonuclease/phosphatase family metal-dependent hydrolase
LGPAVSAQTRTIRVVTYNIEADINGATNALPGLIAPSSGGSITNGGVLEGIGEERLGNDPAQPLDILALQETTSNNTTVAPIVNALNIYYNSPGMYAMSTYQATESGGFAGSGNGPNTVIYNTHTLQLLASVPVDPPGGTGQLGSSSGEYREVMRYEFAPAGIAATAANEFYVYVSHYKSGTGISNETARNGEAQIIRNDEADNLPADARVLYVGDYNVSRSGEACYQTIVAPAAPNGAPQGQGIDPMNPTGSSGISWETNSLMSLKSESATDLRYRDDFQIMTTNVYYGLAGGLALVPGTYHVFGNNGMTAYQGSVNSGGNTALTNLAPGSPITATQLYDYLTTASDHLPVVADYTIPVPATLLDLKLGNVQALSNGFQFAVSNANGTAITASEQARITIFSSTNLTDPFADWKLLTNAMRLTNGFLQITDTNTFGAPQRFYRAMETP